MPASKEYGVRVGNRNWTFRAKDPKDADRVRPIFDAIEAKYGLDELIGVALEVFVDKRLNGAKAIFDYVERTRGGPGHLIDKPTTADILQAYANLGAVIDDDFKKRMGLDGSGESDLEREKRLKKTRAEWAALGTTQEAWD